MFVSAAHQPLASPSHLHARSLFDEADVIQDLFLQRESWLRRGRWAQKTAEACRFNCRMGRKDRYWPSSIPDLAVVCLCPS